MTVNGVSYTPVLLISLKLPVRSFCSRVHPVRFLMYTLCDRKLNGYGTPLFFTGTAKMCGSNLYVNVRLRANEPQGLRAVCGSFRYPPFSSWRTWVGGGTCLAGRDPATPVHQTPIGAS